MKKQKSKKKVKAVSKKEQKLQTQLAEADHYHKYYKGAWEEAKINLHKIMDAIGCNYYSECVGMINNLHERVRMAEAQRSTERSISIYKDQEIMRLYNLLRLQLGGEDVRPEGAPMGVVGSRPGIGSC